MLHGDTVEFFRSDPRLALLTARPYGRAAPPPDPVCPKAYGSWAPGRGDEGDDAVVPIVP